MSTKRKEDSRGPVSESFIMGTVAMIFLITGYQTATFIHKAAVVKIAADRDFPDTVYVYKGGSEDCDSSPSDSVIRSAAPRSRTAEAVRRNMPRSRVESFTFDPNTASVEDLCRLGFSHKQASSIDNYRKKGGRFRRKEDFARSYVVSDSIYTRLEPFIEIPKVDLNLADSADFDNLPGIGGWFAVKIIEHRTALGGYSYKEQLMDIWKFDRERFDALSDLVTVSEKYVKPYPLWTLPADSLSMHPYIGAYAAKGIVLFRENNPVGMWTMENLEKAGILRPEYMKKLSGCRIAAP